LPGSRSFACKDKLDIRWRYVDQSDLVRPRRTDDDEQLGKEAQMRAIASERLHRVFQSVTGFHALRAGMVMAALTLTVSAFAPAASAADAGEAAKTFNQRCTACHTFGKGIKVGPDLKGVTERRSRVWLLRFIRSSQSMIDSGDPVAVGLFQEFKQQRMPDWTDLSEQQIGAILDWLAANGPEQKPADERAAELATPAEIDLGRALFHGSTSLAGGGISCASCHSVRDGGDTLGGSFGGDLTAIYADYRDRALTLAIRRPCFKRLPESAAAGFLLPYEVFALKAYLLQTAVEDRAPSRPSAAGKLVEWARRPSGAVASIQPERETPARARLLFLFFPYAACAVLVLGLAVRLALARPRMEAVRAGARLAWQRFSGGTAWRVGLAATAVGHVVGLLTPHVVLAWNGTPLRLHLIEGAGFLFGLLLLAGWARLMWRHLGRTAASRAGRAAEVADCAFLSLFFVAIASGLLTAALHRWGSSWASGTLAPYLATLVRGAPATDFVASMPLLVRLHVLSLFALIALLPFTSAALVPVAALDRVLSLCARPGTTLGRAARAALHRLSPARWIWPEEDLLEAPGETESDRPPARS
jgi:mono/diheme cytochrome c family protein/nitrate reductase gamma subunit